MVDQIIRPADLPNRANPVASEKVPVDNGVSVGGATIQAIVEAGRPAASQAEAEAGTNSVKAMTPLTTKQAVDAQVPPQIDGAIAALNLGSAAQANTTDFATSAQGGKADSAIQEIVEGANTTVDNTDPQRPIISSSGNPSVGFKSDIVVIDGQTDWRVARNYKTVSDLLADNGSGDMGMGYAGSGANVIVAPGDIITAQGFRYEVSASGATDHHITTAGGVRLYANSVNGVVNADILAIDPYGSSNVTEELETLNLIAVADNAHTVMLRGGGQYLADGWVLRSGIKYTAGLGGATIRRADGALVARPPNPGASLPQHFYKAFVRNEHAGEYDSSDKNITVENLTLDWDNKPGGDGNSIALLWLGNIKNPIVRNVRTINGLTSDYVAGQSTSARDAGLFLTETQNGLVEFCEFASGVGYEELGIRLYHENLTIRQNKFDSLGPWRHNIEVTVWRDLAGSSTKYSKNILIEDNIFILRGRRQDCISSHRGGHIIVRGNTFVLSEGVEDIQGPVYGARCFVKHFDIDQDCSFTVVDNLFDFTALTVATIEAMECVRLWSGFATVRGNKLRGRTDRFYNPTVVDALNTANVPLIGTRNTTSIAPFNSADNIVIADNVIELHQYDPTKQTRVIMVTGDAVSVHDNSLILKNPVAAAEFMGVRFIDALGGGANVANGHNRGLSIRGNVAYSSVATSIAFMVQVQGGYDSFNVIGNVGQGVRTPYLEGSGVGAKKYSAGNF